MSKAPIAVWHHARVSGEGINTAHAVEILSRQFSDMMAHGLFQSAAVVIVGCSEGDSAIVEANVPHGTFLIRHPDGIRSELPTLAALRGWLPGNADWTVFYHHIKCATRADSLCSAWRNCMTRHLVHGWRQCAGLLDGGLDVVGTHWLHPNQHPSMTDRPTPFFAGNFWWAKASFLLELPSIPDKPRPGSDDRFMAESWIGLGRTPKLHDFHPQWPNEIGCSRS